MSKAGIKIVKSPVKGNVTITTSSQYNNINAENVVVEKEITARLFGTVNGRLQIKQGAKVYLHGIVKGSIENEGGELHIYI